MDVEKHLALNTKIEIERQRVEREIDRALDGVFDSDEAVVDVASRDLPQYLVDGVDRDDLGRSQIGLAEQRLLGERAEGDPKTQPGCWPESGWRPQTCSSQQG